MRILHFITYFIIVTKFLCDQFEREKNSCSSYSLPEVSGTWAWPSDVSHITHTHTSVFAFVVKWRVRAISQ